MYDLDVSADSFEYSIFWKDGAVIQKSDETIVHSAQVDAVEWRWVRELGEMGEFAQEGRLFQSALFAQRFLSVRKNLVR